MFYMSLRDYKKAEKSLAIQGKNCLATRRYGSWGYIRVGGGGDVGEGGQKGCLTQDSQPQRLWMVTLKFYLWVLCTESLRLG